MPALYEINQVGKRQEIADAVFNIRADQTPFTSLVKKDPTPAQKICTWQVETYDAVGHSGVPDGQDVTSFSHQGRALLTGVAQKLVVPWMVSDFASETKVAGVPGGEVGRQRAIALKQLKFAMESRCLSNLDCKEEPTDSANETRGAFMWLSPTAQALYPVPAAFLPKTGTTYSGTLANFTESSLESLLAECFMARRGTVTIDQFTGIELQRKIDGFSARDETASGGGTAGMPVRSFTQPGTSGQLVKWVTFLRYSSGTVRLHPSTFLVLNADGTESAYTHKSAIGVDLSMWALAFLGDRQPRLVDLENKGGGPRGYADAIMVLKCFNPLAQYRILINS